MSTSDSALPEDPTQILKTQCINTLYEFLDASVEVWPKCEALAKYLSMFKEGRSLQSVALSLYLHEQVMGYQSYFQRLEAKDLTVFQEPVEIFTELNIYAKLSEASPEVQETCWSYIKQIVQSASLSKVYGTAPTVMLEKVNKVAESFMKRMEEGTFDVKELDPMALTQMMMEGVDKNEMEKWASEVMNPQSINSLMGVMQSVMGGMGEEGNKIDFASIAGSMASSMGSMGSGGMGLGALGEGGINPELIQQMMGGLMKNLKK
jgi:hypothetical protein